MVWLALGLVGAGLYLAHDGLTRPAAAAPHAPSRALLRLQDWLLQAGLEGVTPRTVLLVSLGGALLGGLLAHALLGWPVADLAGILTGGLAYPLWLRARHARHRACVQRALPEAIEQLRDALGSGLTLDRAFQGLAEQGPEALRPYAAELCAELRYVPFAAAVERLRDRLADPSFDLVASALLLHDEVGGRRFRACLGELAAGLRADLATRERLGATRARIVYSARLLALAPVALLLLVRGWSPAAAQVFDGPVGQLLLAGCGAAVAMGYAGMLWLSRLPEEERVLVR